MQYRYYQKIKNYTRQRFTYYWRRRALVVYEKLMNSLKKLHYAIILLRANSQQKSDFRKVGFQNWNVNIMQSLRKCNWFLRGIDHIIFKILNKSSATPSPSWMRVRVNAYGPWVSIQHLGFGADVLGVVDEPLSSIWKLKQSIPTKQFFGDISIWGL